MEGKTRLATVPAAKKNYFSAVGSTPIGLRGRSISHTGPPLLVLLLAVSLVPSNECMKCYQQVSWNRKMVCTMAVHSHINSRCYNCRELTVCKYDQHEYWVGKSLGIGGTRLGVHCPRGEQWLCFTKAGHWDISDGGGVQDMIKAEIVKNKIEQIKKKITQKFDGELYAKIRKQLEEEIGLPTLGKNLFVDSGERISRELNVTNGWICGGPVMTEEWPWEGSSLGPVELLKWNRTSSTREDRPEGWILSSITTGEECLRREGKNYLKSAGHSPCKRLQISNGTSTWWYPEKPKWVWALNNNTGNCEYDSMTRLFKCKKRVLNPYQNIPEISKFWENIAEMQTEFWKAPEGLFWICGKRAYSELPSKWKGSCTLGIIQPGFFLMPGPKGDDLGVPVYESLKRTKREIIGGSQRWGEEDWPPERIIQAYGPATSAQDGSWGYWTPIYMLNRIVRLQAVVEIISNRTARAINLIMKQQKQMRAAIHQNRLALDYFLAEEGGVCGKWNTSDCCLKIDDNGDAILELTEEIRKIAHVPVQKWESMLNDNWWNNVFGGSWWKKLGYILLWSIAGLLFLPCLIPCFIRLMITVVQSMQVVPMPKTPKLAASGSTKKVMVLRRIRNTPQQLEEAESIYEENKWIKQNESYGSSQM
ncbi:endogenous retrovirus group 3 member 1 Env polyprotein-like [Chroicocephalus ridibundus]|uniref:endogenous retrovirus group 3 member 1 Env polyprotein-like n=1 Tax=Chroicocephalus ridibundus TaxID=1192867 RepID=UPI002FDDAA7C